MRMAAFTIRSAVDQDFRSVLEIQNDPSVMTASGRSKPISLDEHLDWWVANSKSVDVVVDEDDTVIGFGRLDKTTEWSIQIVSLAVAAAYRGAGIGQRLLEALINSARRSGALSVLARIRTDNDRSNALFSKAGFKKVVGAYGSKQEREEEWWSLRLV